jgi:hypothetical protein
MHALLTPEVPDNARGNPAIGRRGFLAAGAVSVAAVALPAAVEAAETSDLLAFMIDSYKELDAQATAIQEQYKNLVGPLRARVTLREVFSRELDYQPDFRSCAFLDFNAIDTFFGDRLYELESFASLVAGMTARIKVDWARARQLLQERSDEHERYWQQPEIQALLASEEELGEQIADLKWKICELPCKSLRDVQMKATFVSRWFDEPDDYYPEFVAVLRSVSGETA